MHCVFFNGNPFWTNYTGNGETFPDCTQGYAFNSLAEVETFAATTFGTQTNTPNTGNTSNGSTGTVIDSITGTVSFESGMTNEQFVFFAEMVILAFAIAISTKMILRILR